MSQHYALLGTSTRCVDQGICDAQTERRGRVSEDSLGWGEGAKARDGWARNRHRQRGLVGAKGLKPGRQLQGIQAVSGLG